MKITEIRINKVNSDKTSTKAFASITFDDMLVVSGVAVIEGKKGLFVSMPQNKGKNAKGEDVYFDIVFPKTKEGRETITKQILEEYNKTI